MNISNATAPVCTFMLSTLHLWYQHICIQRRKFDIWILDLSIISSGYLIFRLSPQGASQFSFTVLCPSLLLIMRSTRCEFYHQRSLPPNQVNRLRFQPVVIVPIQRKVKPVHHTREKETHLAICKRSADAVTRPETEGLEDKAIIAVEAMIIERVRRRQPALRMEGVGIGKVFGAVETCPLICGDPSLSKVSGVFTMDSKKEYRSWSTWWTKFKFHQEREKKKKKGKTGQIWL